MPVDDDKFMDEEEIERLITKACRKGYKICELEFMTMEQIRQLVDVIQ